MDFGIYPPEINSGRMYTGPGSGPLLAAAQAWDDLADELFTAASQYEAVIAGLTGGPWSGPSAESMAAAAASHVEWLGATATQAADTAAQARAAAAAYSAAFASTVPPEVVAANRTQLMTLIATNFFGQNLPAIAATEAQYAEMWAQDAAAMYGYAGSSAAASVLTPFSSPHQITNPGGPAAQAAAVNQAVGTSAAGDAQSVVSTVSQTSPLTGALQSLATAAPAQAADPLGTLSDLITVFLSAPANVALFGAIIPGDFLTGPVNLPVDFVGAISGARIDDIVSGWNGEEGWPGTGPAPVTQFPAPLTNLPTGTVPATVSAASGGADTIGALSVPQAWTAAAPEIRSLAYTLPTAAGNAAATGAAEASSGIPFGQLGLAAMTGPGLAGPPGGDGGMAGDKTKIGQRLPARVAGASGDARSDASRPEQRVVVTGVANRIREIAQLRDEGKLTEQEFIEQKNRLLGR